MSPSVEGRVQLKQCATEVSASADAEREPPEDPQVEGANVEPGSPSPVKPKLRAVEAHAIEHEGQSLVLLSDPLRLTDSPMAIPRPLAPLLALMDGTRDRKELEAVLRVRAGLGLAPGLLDRLVDELDAACLLESESFFQARAEAIRAYRDAPHRPTTLGGSSFPTDPSEAAKYLQAYVDALPASASAADGGSIVGLVSPHIDYQRGGAVYAEVWRAVAKEAREADLVIILGTDHQGGDPSLTLTRQSYATPWGILPTDQDVVDQLVEVLGDEACFSEELHHRGEHSIELAALWLHFVRDGKPVPLLPILCGHYGGFILKEGDPAAHEPFAQAVGVLRRVAASRRTLVVAAADLAHMGPAFGDPHGLDFVARAQLRNADERLLAAVHAGDAAGFFEQLRAERDRRHVCGLPPIYLTLRLFDGLVGEPAGYALCPADPQGLSYVSIAGVVLRRLEAAS